MRMGALPLLVALLSQGCNNAPDNRMDAPVALKLNFKPNAKYQYIKTSSEVLEPEGKTQSFLINQDRTTEATYQVASEGDNKRITLTFDRIAIKAGNNNVVALSYDSRDTTKQKAEVFNSLTSILHRPYMVVIDKNGAIVRGDKTAIDTTTNSSMLGFSNSSMDATVQELFNIYPGIPVKPGDSWKKWSDIMMGFVNVESDDTYKLISVEKGIAHVEVNANLHTAPADSTDVSMKGIQVGTLDIDIASGLIVNGKLSGHINGNMKLGINAATSLSSEITIAGKKL